jgi:hypothetical protein
LLEAGDYTAGLPVHNLNGTDENPIIIAGSDAEARAVFHARSCCNTVSILDSSYVEIRNLELDGGGTDLADAVKAEGHANWAHHITLENLYIHGHDGDQQIVGISTKCPAWDWVIRNNIIVAAGTGLYLGNSNGDDPFINGVIEGNLIVDTIGYNMQIKHQNPWPDLPGLPTSGPTIVRHNVFSKANNGSTGGMARPNLLVGHWPLSGPGTDNVYLIYGNFFYDNPTGEPLFQGEGNVAVYDNLFVNSNGSAMWIQPHNDVPKMVRIFNNTVVANGTGIRVSGGHAAYEQKVIGNAVFAGTPVSADDQTDNITDASANAADYLVDPVGSPTGSPSQLDLYPLPGALTGSPLDSSSFNTFQDWDRGFNSETHDGTFRGAYAGEGANPGWLPKLERKPYFANPTLSLELVGTPARQTIYLSWVVTGTLPPTSTWQIDYWSATGTVVLPAATGLVSPTRAYTLPGLTNRVWYTVNLSGMLDSTPLLTDTVVVMPADIFVNGFTVYLPLILNGAGD